MVNDLGIRNSLLHLGLNFFLGTTHKIEVCLLHHTGARQDRKINAEDMKLEGVTHQRAVLPSKGTSAGWQEHHGVDQGDVQGPAPGEE